MARIAPSAGRVRRPRRAPRPEAQALVRVRPGAAPGTGTGPRSHRHELATLPIVWPLLALAMIVPRPGRATGRHERPSQTDLPEAPDRRLMLRRPIPDLQFRIGPSRTCSRTPYATSCPPWPMPMRPPSPGTSWPRASSWTRTLSWPWRTPARLGPAHHAWPASGRPWGSRPITPANSRRLRVSSGPIADCPAARTISRSWPTASGQLGAPRPP